MLSLRLLVSSFFPYTTLFRSCETRPEANRHHLASGRPEKDVQRGGHPCFDRGPGSAGDDAGDDRRFPEFKKAHCRSEEHTSELQSLTNLVCRLLLEKKKKKKN